MEKPEPLAKESNSQAVPLSFLPKCALIREGVCSFPWEQCLLSHPGCSVEARKTHSINNSRKQKQRLRCSRSWGSTRSTQKGHPEHQRTALVSGKG